MNIPASMPETANIATCTIFTSDTKLIASPIEIPATAPTIFPYFQPRTIIIKIIIILLILKPNKLILLKVVLAIAIITELATNSSIV